MKILHTSDWHLGHTLYNYDRTEEQIAMLQQMVTIVKAEQPDLFLLCGDVYHTAQPSSSVQTLFTNALVEIHDANPKMTIVITAGNHDSGTKHEIFRTPWKALKVHTIGQLNKEKIDEHIIKVADKGYVVAIPYTNERNIPEGFYQTILDKVAQENEEGLPVIMTAHTTVKGCDFTGHDYTKLENESWETVGGIDSLQIEEMGIGYDYLALGHIHREQFVHTGQHNVRYCGTPIPVSFDENYPHSVSLVETDHQGERPNVRKIEIENPHPLVTLPPEGSAPWNEAINLLKEFPYDISAYIRLNVMVDEQLPANAFNEALQVTEGKNCRFCHINTKRQESANTQEKVLTVQEFQAEDPMEIVKHYVENQGVPFDEELKELFHETILALNEDLNNE